MTISTAISTNPPATDSAGAGATAAPGESFDQTIPLVDLGAQHAEVGEEIRAGLERVMTSGAFIGGNDVRMFEREFAAFCGAEACVGVANGTDALELTLRALEIGPGDEVVLPANTFIATAEAVDRAGARPVLVDCDDGHLLIDPDRVADRIGPSTRAVIGVDLYGQIAPFERLAGIVRHVDGAERISLIEDAAQSQGATRFGDPIGAHSIAAATSFYPGKNLGAYGDAGGVVTNDIDLALGLRAIANHGGLKRYEHRLRGVNSRLDTMQAVVLRVKLQRLADWNAARRAAAERYDQLLADLPVRLAPCADGNVHVWHLYVIRVSDRDRVLASLNDAGIGAGIHYPTPIHLTPAYAHLGGRPGDFPNAEAAGRSMISLPMHPHITASQQERIVSVLRDAL